VTILLAATILAAGPIYANAVAASGLERTLADAPARDSGLQVSARIPLDDLDRTSPRVERTLKDAFGDASAPVYRSAVSDSYELPAARGREQGSLAVFAFYDDLPANADLVGGRWPSAGTSTEAVLSVGAARSLGLALGDSIELTSVIDESRRVPVTVGGIYRPRNPRGAVRWGRPLETQGSQRIRFPAFGPLVFQRGPFPPAPGAGGGAEAMPLPASVRGRAAPVRGPAPAARSRSGPDAR